MYVVAVVDQWVIFYHNYQVNRKGQEKVENVKELGTIDKD